MNKKKLPIFVIALTLITSLQSFACPVDNNSFCINDKIIDAQQRKGIISDISTNGDNTVFYNYQEDGLVKTTSAPLSSLKHEPYCTNDNSICVGDTIIHKFTHEENFIFDRLQYGTVIAINPNTNLVTYQNITVGTLWTVSTDASNLYITKEGCTKNSSLCIRESIDGNFKTYVFNNFELVYRSGNVVAIKPKTNQAVYEYKEGDGSTWISEVDTSTAAKISKVCSPTKCFKRLIFL